MAKTTRALITGLNWIKTHAFSLTLVLVLSELLVAYVAHGASA